MAQSLHFIKGMLTPKFVNYFTLNQHYLIRLIFKRNTLNKNTYTPTFKI